MTGEAEQYDARVDQMGRDVVDQHCYDRQHLYCAAAEYFHFIRQKVLFLHIFYVLV